MADLFLKVLGALGGAGAIILLFSSWLGKVWANRILEKDRLKYNQQLELMKTDLGRASQEYLIRFSTLHVDRANIIRQLAGKLTATQRIMHSTLKRFQAEGEPSLVDKIKSLTKSFDDFYQFYLDNRIYFRLGLCKQIDALALKLRNIHIYITTYPVDPNDIEYQLIPNLATESKEIWKQARTIFDNEVQALSDNIEKEFRAILGVES